MTVRRFEVDDDVRRLAEAFAAAGGRALVVGGWVRDRLLGHPSKDYDFEVYGLELAALQSVLERFGEVIAVGRAFGVLRVKGLDYDFSIPRRDSKTGRGHRGFLVEFDPSLDFATAASRRDLTINSMGYDPLGGELLDPHGGAADLERGVLRAVDPVKFAEDSLRGLRVAQFAARLEMTPDAGLLALCSSLDLSDLPGERILEELKKLLLKSRRPSIGFELMRETGMSRIFPELEAMIGVPQDPEWHPEGTVWEHTMLVLDQAASLRTGEPEDDLVLMLGALCHDLGKPETTVETDGRIRSPRHEEAGVAPTEAMLERLRVSRGTVARVVAIVRHHLAPAHLSAGGATAKAYRRLSRKLEEAGIDAKMLHRAASADHFGRTTPDALAREFPAGDDFLARMAELDLDAHGQRDVVLGRHLIQRGLRPGPRFGEILAACRDVQDETGWDDPERILDRVLSRS